jgi:aerotaxis receptor
LRIEREAGPAKACEASLAWLTQKLEALGTTYEALVLELFFQGGKTHVAR